MHLLAELESRLKAENSMFRVQLMREDIARLQRLHGLAEQHPSFEDFARHGLYIGWTQGDFRTHELKRPIESLLAALYAYKTGGRTDDQDKAVRRAWQAFDRERMEKLAGCL